MSDAHERDSIQTVEAFTEREKAALRSAAIVYLQQLDQYPHRGQKNIRKSLESAVVKLRPINDEWGLYGD